MHLRPIYPSLCGGSLGVVGLDSSLEGLGVRAHNLGYLVAVLEEEESRHGADAEFLGDIGDLVDVELVEARIGVCVGEPGADGAVSKLSSRIRWRGEDSLDDLRRNHLAGPAPRREAVEDEERVLGLEGRVPVGLAILNRQYGRSYKKIMTSPLAPVTASARETEKRGPTHVFKLCTPSLLMVVEKNLCVRMGR